MLSLISPQYSSVAASGLNRRYLFLGGRISCLCGSHGRQWPCSASGVRPRNLDRACPGRQAGLRARKPEPGQPLPLTAAAVPLAAGRRWSTVTGRCQCGRSRPAGCVPLAVLVPTGARAGRVRMLLARNRMRASAVSCSPCHKVAWAFPWRYTGRQWACELGHEWTKNASASAPLPVLLSRNPAARHRPHWQLADGLLVP